MLYRIKQFIWASTAVFKKRDLEYINKYLNEKEKRYFFSLIASEQEHSLRVSKDMLTNSILKGVYSDLDLIEIAKLGLLHDIGKSEYALGIWGKSIIVILDKFSNGKLKKYNNFKKIDIYYNHASKGIKILRKINDNYNDEFLDAIEKHHNNIEFITKTNNKRLQLLVEFDNKN